LVIVAAVLAVVALGCVPDPGDPTPTTTTTTLAPCIQSCDGATLTMSVNRQPSDVWGFVTGSGLMPGAVFTLCDNVVGCYANGTVAPDGSASRGPLYCCNAVRTFVYASS